jgi:hypothetical protein
MPLRDRLQVIAGRSLTIVVFIHDYVQLSFDGPTLTTFSLPVFTQFGNAIRVKQAGYCDALCAQIDIVVATADVTDEELVVRFVNGAQLTVSLHDHEYVGPEAIVFDSEEGKVVV